MLANVDLLLRDRSTLLARVAHGEQQGSLARSMILTILCGGALYGAALGAFRGDLQILYAAVKLPLAILATAAICAPALSAVNAGLGRPASLARDVAHVLCALALGSLVLAAQAPLVLLAYCVKASYHSVVLLAVGSCAVAGAWSMAAFFGGLGRVERRARVSAGLTLIAVFALVGAQVTWTLRPYLLRPAASAPVFVRAVEGSFYDAVLGSTRSARGIYTPTESTEGIDATR